MVNESLEAENVRIQRRGYEDGLKVTELDMKLAARQVRIISKMKGKIIDIGCSEGTLTMELAKSNEVVGVDLCTNALRIAKSKGLTVKEGNAYELPFPDNSFDIAHMSEVIEHILEPLRAMSEVKRVLKSGGVFVMTTPNCTSFRDKLLVLAGHMQAYSQHSEHVRLYNKRLLEKLVKDSGFKLLGTYGSGFSFPLPFGLSPVTTLFDWLLPAGLMQRVIVVCEVIK